MAKKSKKPADLNSKAAAIVASSTERKPRVEVTMKVHTVQAIRQPRDISEVSQTEGMTLGQVVKTLSGLAHDVGELKGSVSKLTWSVPLIVGIGMAVVTFVASSN